jgi:F-type H+-transporting ATPase subunit gamma
VGAMRGMAAARAHEAHARLAGIRASAAATGTAIGDLLAFVRDVVPEFAPAGVANNAAPAQSGAEVCIVVGTEQGFVGGLNDAIAEHALHTDAARKRTWLLVGTRLAGAFAQRSVHAFWSASMAAHCAGVPRLAARVTDALYARLGGDGQTTRVSMIHAQPGESRLHITQRTLVPFDFARFHVTSRVQPPLVNLPPACLLAGLVERYVYVELCEALMLSFAAENEARVRAMLAARTNVQQRLNRLTQQHRAMRQDEITSEIVELGAASEAGRHSSD